MGRCDDSTAYDNEPSLRLGAIEAHSPVTQGRRSAATKREHQPLARGDRAPSGSHNPSGFLDVKVFKVGLYLDRLSADVNGTSSQACTALAESKIRLLCWLRYVRP